MKDHQIERLEKRVKIVRIYAEIAELKVKIEDYEGAIEMLEAIERELN